MENQEAYEKRFDRIERTLEAVANKMDAVANATEAIAHSNKQLLIAQVVMSDELTALTKLVNKLAITQGEMQEGLTVVMRTVDGWIRSNPRPSA